jgi:galacturonosyltransferase
MYRIAFKKSKFIFFQNQHNFDLFNQFKLPINNAILVHGSGVSLNKFSCLKNENKSFNEIDIYFIGRIMKSKGIDLFLKAARYIKINHSNAKFHVIGRYDGNYEKLMEAYIADETIKYHGEVKNVRDHYKKSDLVILPSYHEGLSNVILESAASCRPVIASNIPGCKEIVEHNKSGYLFSLGNQEELCFYIEKFLKLSVYERISMGKHGRKIIESKFNRKIVTESYLKVIKSM